MMNKKAVEMGLKDTHFVNPVGLHDDNHYTTANDIQKMAVKAFQNDLIKRFCSASRYTLSPTNMAGERTIVTSNMLLNPNSNVYYKYAGAGKTGYTSKAGRCLVSTAKYNGYEYLAIVLNANTAGGARYDFIDIANMFRWAFNNFEYKTVFESTTPIAEAPIRLSAESDHLPICFAGGLKTILPKEADASTIKYELHLNEEVFTATVNKGDVVGAYYSNTDKSNITVMPYGGDFSTSAEYWEDFKKRCADEFSEFEVIKENAPKVVSGRNALQFVYKLKIDGVVYQCQQTVLAYGNLLYVITYTAKTDKYESHLADIDNILSVLSFK
jgi:D-alanyl-D-alanine carboxypeptidase